MAAVLLSACNVGVSGAAPPGSGGPNTAGEPFKGCTITAAGRNISSKSNVGISTINSDDSTKINCGGAGEMKLASIADSAIEVASDGENVTVAAGETKQVGPYQVAVLSVTDGTAVFTMAPPS